MACTLYSIYAGGFSKSIFNNRFVINCLYQLVLQPKNNNYVNTQVGFCIRAQLELPAFRLTFILLHVVFLASMLVSP